MYLAMNYKSSISIHVKWHELVCVFGHAVFVRKNIVLCGNRPFAHKPLDLQSKHEKFGDGKNYDLSLVV